VLYSQANTEDRENRISNTLFQQQLALSTPDAYNPFSGGCTTSFSAGDCTPSQAAAIRAITVPVFRRNETSIALWDFKVSRPDLFTIWAGDIGIAAGVELRHEEFLDDRDPRQDGTVNFTDSISGLTTNDLMGNNPTLDTQGERDVSSAYVELAVPLVSPEMNVPLVQSIDMQLAARYENFDTFGDVTKPKVALSWRHAAPLGLERRLPRAQPAAAVRDRPAALQHAHRPHLLRGRPARWPHHAGPVHHHLSGPRPVGHLQPSGLDRPPAGGIGKPYLRRRA
jgi:hypothetical protein